MGTLKSIMCKNFEKFLKYFGQSFEHIFDLKPSEITTTEVWERKNSVFYTTMSNIIKP